MTMPDLPRMLLVPESDSYSETEGAEVIATRLDGGQARYRRDKIGVTTLASVQWKMNPGQYQYWRAFFVGVLKRGTLPFICQLVSEDGTGPSDHVCTFVPGSVAKPGQQGLTYIQTAQLEVVPLPHDEVFDVAVVALFESAGPDGAEALSLMARLVNTTMPDHLHA